METTYELYVLSEGRWLLEARFDAARRAEAIRTAKMIEAHGCGELVKLVRETLDGRTLVAKETVVYNGLRRRDVREWRRTHSTEEPGPYAQWFEDPATLAIAAASAIFLLAQAAKALGKVAAIAAASVAIAVLAAVVHRGMLTMLA